ncbi:MAG: hypothetical protein LC098_05650 [Burkholderiales bacterium]|nr:hypothetical protein [Burkholderiales bacterium]
MIASVGTGRSVRAAQHNTGEKMNVKTNALVTLFMAAAMAAAAADRADPPGRVASAGAPPTPEALGTLNADLVFTPITPCRIVDTRLAGSGALNANSTRNFIALNAANFSSQGGSSSNCGTLGLNAGGVVLVVTAITPSAAGYATLHAYGSSTPATVNLQYAAGAIQSGSQLVQIPNPLSSYDFTLYTSAQSHFTIDFVGYFAPPVATALACSDTSNTVASVAAGGSANVTAPLCPSGYTPTATNCESGTWDMPLVFFHGGTCSAKNNGAAPAELRASRTCCRVPGR